jgi:NAD(P)-dependent dehydrogenase (short-subunit alcohol dehydrogenase family)
LTLVTSTVTATVDPARPLSRTGGAVVTGRTDTTSASAARSNDLAAARYSADVVTRPVSGLDVDPARGTIPRRSLPEADPSPPTFAAVSNRRIALVADTSFYVGPAIARLLAGRGHDLVIAAPEDGLVDELEAAGASVEVVPERVRLRDGEAIGQLVDRGLERFGRIDAAVAFTGRVVTGTFAESTPADLDRAVQGCLVEPFHFLHAVLPPMTAAGSGQVLVFTSATGSRPSVGAPLYSSARAAANMLVRNVAAEVAPSGVQVNAIGTNFMDFPEFRRASGADDPAVRARIEAAVPLRRLGTMEECAAFAMPFVDGTSTFTTGQVVNYAGGWA